MIKFDSEREFNIKHIFRADLVSGESVKIDKGASSNIIGGGICLYTDEVYPLQEGMQVYLTFSVPKKESKVYTISKVIYINQVNQGLGRKFKIGFQFLSIKDEHKKDIMDFITR